MSNYIIEGEIDFWSEVNAEIENDENLCMLTKVPLSTNHITLPCGHKFNYTGLVKEIMTNKNAYRYRSRTILQAGFTKCPYCRIHHKGLLLWIPDNNINHIPGVTTIFKNALPTRQCTYIKKTGKCKGEKCISCLAYETKNGVYCRTHQKSMVNSINKLKNKIEEKRKLTTMKAELEIKIKSERPELLKLKINDLKKILSDNNLSRTGTKVILAGRIMDNNI